MTTEERAVAKVPAHALPGTPLFEELLALLDPDRDYGERSYEDVVRECREGALLLAPNPHGEVMKQPFISSADPSQGRRRVKGTGMPHPVVTGFESVQKWNHKWFLERMQEDREKVYSSLLRSITGDSPDPRAIKIWFEYGIGVPFRNMPNGASTDAIKALLEIGKAVEQNPQQWDIEIDPETGQRIE